MTTILDSELAKADRDVPVCVRIRARSCGMARAIAHCQQRGQISRSQAGRLGLMVERWRRDGMLDRITNAITTKTLSLR